MENRATGLPNSSSVDTQRLPWLFANSMDSLTENPWTLRSVIFLSFAIFYWVLSGWNVMDHNVIQSIEAMGNLTSHYARCSNGSNGLFHSMAAFESASISLATWSEVHHTAIELDADSRLPNQKAISIMWNNMIDDVASVMDTSQQLNAKGKWDLHILLVEYKVYFGSKMSSGVNYEHLVSKIVRLLHTLSNHLEELEASMIKARHSNAAVHSSLYSTKNHQELESEERGLTQWLVSHFRGNRAFLRQQQELNLIRSAIQRTIEVSAYLGGMELRLKSYKDTILAVHDSIKVEQAQGCRKLRASICLVFLESIFNCLE